MNTVEVKRYTCRSFGIAIALVTLNIVLVPFSTEATFIGYTGLETLHNYLLKVQPTTFWDRTRHILFLYLFPLYIVSCYVAIGKVRDS